MPAETMAQDSARREQNRYRRLLYLIEKVIAAGDLCSGFMVYESFKDGKFYATAWDGDRRSNLDNYEIEFWEGEPKHAWIYGKPYFCSPVGKMAAPRIGSMSIATWIAYDSEPDNSTEETLRNVARLKKRFPDTQREICYTTP